MPKTPSTKLFNFIKKLSGSEKRYFKLWVARTEGDAAKYLQLFEALEGQQEYDENVLKNLIYQTNNLETRKFSELKNYLYDLILKALRDYDEGSSIDFQLKNLLANVRVLAKRSFYAECREILEKAKKIALQYESFLVLLEIAIWEKRIAYAESDIDFLDKNLLQISEEEKKYLTNIQAELSYWKIYFTLLTSSKKETTLRSEEKKNFMKTLFNTPILYPKAKPPTYQSEILYHRSYGYFYSSLGDFEQFYASNQRLIDIMDAHKTRLKEDPSHYISVVNNQIFACGMLRKYEQVEELLNKLKSITAKTADDKFKIFTQYYLNKLVLCTENGDFQAGILTIQQREEERKQFPKAIFQANFYFLYAYIFFGTKKYNDALTWLNELLSMPKSIVRQDLQSVARIVHLIVHYEMNNRLLLDSLIRSTYRFLRKQDRFYEFESLMLRFLKKVKDINSKKEKQQLFAELKKQLQLLLEKKNESAVFRYFNFIAWAESNFKGTAFSEEVRKQK